MTSSLTTDSSDLASTVRQAGLADFRRAAERIGADCIRSPLLPSESRDRTLRLKAECLQPLGSFKIRPAAHILQTMDAARLRRGVATASAGNFAQGLALAAQRRDIHLTVHAPESAARVKLDVIRSLGATVILHSFADWWSIMSSRDTGADDGVFVHPVCEPEVIVGNGTVGLELSEDWPELDTVVIPFGGGGLSCGIALALRALGRNVRIVACEIETSTPLTAAFAAGSPVAVERQPSFVDGIGSNGVLPQMWPLVQELIDDVIVVSLPEAQAAVRELALRHHLVAEGAGAVAFAAARAPQCAKANVAAVISGGNIDTARLRSLLD